MAPARSFALPPIFLKCPSGNWRQIARFGPGVCGIQASAFDKRMELLKQSSGLLCESIDPRAIYHISKELECKFFKSGWFLVRRISPVLQQVMMQVDFDRAGFGAGAAQRTRRRQMFPILQSG